MAKKDPTKGQKKILDSLKKLKDSDKGDGSDWNKAVAKAIRIVEQNDPEYPDVNDRQIVLDALMAYSAGIRQNVQGLRQKPDRMSGEMADVYQEELERCEELFGRLSSMPAQIIIDRYENGFYPLVQEVLKELGEQMKLLIDDDSKEAMRRKDAFKDQIFALRKLIQILNDKGAELPDFEYPEVEEEEAAEEDEASS